MLVTRATAANLSQNSTWYRSEKISRNCSSLYVVAQREAGDDSEEESAAVRS